MTYFVAALAASGIFLVAGWRSRQARGMASGRYAVQSDLLWAEAERDVSDTQADAGVALRIALKRLAPVLASHSIQADVAAPMGLLVRMRGSALADLLEELLAAVLHTAPASRLLLTAAAHGERIYIGITDDMPGADPDRRRAGVRGLIERVAMRGGALDIDVRPAEGTTMTLRLTAASNEKRDRVEPAKTAAFPTVPSVSPSVSSDTNR
jgi:hypothetical protein